MKAVQAIWNGELIAESNQTILVEGNHYFPPNSLHQEYFQPNSKVTICPWKGESKYLDIVVNGEVNSGGCWYYPDPSREASRIKDYYAFWNGVEVVTDTPEQRNQRIAETVSTFLQKINNLERVETNRDEAIVTMFSTFLKQIDTESLNYCLCPDYIQELSFFNFANSTTACFYADSARVIRNVNPTFLWAFNHLPNPIGTTLQDFLAQMGMPGDELEQFMKTMTSHGWVKIPKVQVNKAGETLYFAIDVVITKHGDVDSLTGIQGQFVDVTQEVLLSQEIEDLMDNTGQGFLSFGSSYQINRKYSKACQTFFQQNIEGLDILELLLPETEQQETRQAAKELIDMLFSGIGEMSLLEDLLPKESAIGDRILQLEYRWIPQSETNAESKVMVILTDVTTEKELEAQLKADEERNKTLLKIASDRDGFLEFLRELDRLFKNLYSCMDCGINNIDAHEMFRYYHTIKGGAATYALQKVAEEAHRIESDLEEVRSGRQQLTDSMVAEFRQDTEHLQKLVGETLNEFSQLIPGEERQQTEKVFKISASKLDTFQNKLIALIGNDYFDQIQTIVAEFKKQPIGPLLKKYKLAAETLAEKLGKILEVEIKGTQVEVDFEQLNPLFSTLIHLVRNSVDHGIEEPEMRAMLGKSEVGKLTMAVNQEQGQLQILIQDDGGGIDAETVKNIALNKGIITKEWANSAKAQELVELVFAPGFSTKEAVSDVSGRGVGMDAVKASVEALSGTLNVTTELDQGSTFTITIPDA